MIKADPKKLAEMRYEHSLVLLKPDAVARKISGEIISRFEKKGLKIIALKMTWPTPTQAEEHYEADEDWYISSGTRTYEGYIEKGLKPPLEPRELGVNTRRKLMSSLTAGPVIALVLQGAHVIETVRKMRGATSPQLADVGTIGFDYSLDSYELADAGEWAIRNVIHASDSPESAEREIKIWFKPPDLMEYKTAEDDILYTKDWYGQK